MYSIAFPNIFNGSTVRLYKDDTAINSNLRLLLGSNRGGLYGDPHYGVDIKQILWDNQINPLMRSLVQDEIYEAVKSYMPQCTVDREDITMIDNGNNFVTLQVKVKTDAGIVTDMFNIELLSDND